jgi:linoleate 9S-lipoxygenase
LVFFAGNGTRGKLGNPAHLEEMVVTMKSTAAGESVFKVTFDWDASHGIPGAVVVKNTYRAEFLLKTLTLEGVPGKQDGTVVFVANSWIYPGADRVFFANDVSIHSVLVSHAVQTRKIIFFVYGTPNRTKILAMQHGSDQLDLRKLLSYL